MQYTLNSWILQELSGVVGLVKKRFLSLIMPSFLISPATMLDFLKLLILTAIPTTQNQKSLAIEVLILRQQLAVLNRDKPRPKLRNGDRLFLMTASKILSRWREFLVIVKPETVVGWHRKGFKLFWRLKSRRKTGRPKIPVELRELIKRISSENPTWGSPRIEGELSKLGYSVRKSTIEKYMVKVPKPPSQNWPTFLRNHARDIVACDFFTVPTIWFTTLHVLIFIEHARRKIVHFNISRLPCSEWVALQLTNAFPYDAAPRFLIHDRDPRFQGRFKRRVTVMNIAQVVTARKSPKMNAICERVIGSLRRECLNHVIILDERHLHSILKEYIEGYYHTDRTHQGLDNDCPEPRAVDPPENGKVISIPVLGGLHHRYRRKAA
jgi:putative transposase